MATSEDEYSAINREENEPEAIIQIFSTSFAWSVGESICLLFFSQSPRMTSTAQQSSIADQSDFATVIPVV